MANVNSPTGFEFVRDISSGAYPQYLPYEPVVTNGTEVFRGQLVKINPATGQIAALNGTFVNDSGLAAGSCIGVAAANRVGNVAGTVRCPIILAHNAYFRCQADGTLGASRALVEILIGNGDARYNITAPNSGHAGGLGNSIAQLAVAGAGSEQYLILCAIDSRPDNEFGANIKVIVRFDPRLFTASAAFIDTVAAA